MLLKLFPDIENVSAIGWTYAPCPTEDSKNSKPIGETPKKKKKEKEKQKGKGKGKEKEKEKEKEKQKGKGKGKEKGKEEKEEEEKEKDLPYQLKLYERIINAF